jgi:hypothetical protein
MNAAQRLGAMFHDWDHFDWNAWLHRPIFSLYNNDVFADLRNGFQLLSAFAWVDNHRARIRFHCTLLGAIPRAMTVVANNQRLVPMGEIHPNIPRVGTLPGQREGSSARNDCGAVSCRKGRNTF